MDDEMIARITARVAEVCEKVGYGEVRIIIEKGRPRRVVTAVDEWLEERVAAVAPAAPGRDRHGGQR
jgi:hypothetical protein